MSKMQSAILRISAILIFLNVSTAADTAGVGNETARRSAAVTPADLSPGVWLPIRTQQVELAPSAVDSELQVTLSAAQRTTSYDGRDDQDERVEFDLPLLFLHRQREATDDTERTLNIEIVGLAAGVEVQIEVVSRHVDVSTGAAHRATISYSSPDQPCTPEEPCKVQWVFDARALPSDLYHLLVNDTGGNLLWSNPYPEQPDFAMLDTWDVRIDAYIVRVYYATLFPFAKGLEDLDNRLSPAQVTEFIADRFVPMIVDTWNTQIHEWGFGEPIHPDWDADAVVEVIITTTPYALFGGTGTYTKFVDIEGHPISERRIWWLSSNTSFQYYDSLENGCKVIFAHEFFHLAQWNVLLSAGQASAESPPAFWLNTFIEAQGRFAPSVQHPELELRREHLVVGYSTYVERSANRFVNERLNTSYGEMEAESHERYDLASYWRYLYEQFNSMDVVRVALEEMVRHHDTDIVSAIGNVMNRTFARMDGPIQSHEESVVGFARATYALWLENGRCASEDLSACGENFYDPDGLYDEPLMEARFTYRGGTSTYQGGIEGSYGMDFIEVQLDPDLQNQPLTVTLQGEGLATRFDLQIWFLDLSPGTTRALTPAPETVAQNLDGVYNYVMPQVGADCDILGLIITRLDPNEAVDADGDYRITLESVAHNDYDRDAVTIVESAPVVADGAIAQ